MTEPPSEPSSESVGTRHPAVSLATLTVRVIKSFPYRTCKNVVLHNLDLDTVTAGELKEMVKARIQVQPAFKTYRNVELDTLKLYTKAQGTKTQNLIINMEDQDDALIFEDDTASLASCACEHETEVSFFNKIQYDGFKAHPEEKW